MPNTDVVEYNRTVRTAPTNFRPIRNNRFEIPVPAIAIIIILGTCSIFTSKGIFIATKIKNAKPAQNSETT